MNALIIQKRHTVDIWVRDHSQAHVGTGTVIQYYIHTCFLGDDYNNDDGLTQELL